MLSGPALAQSDTVVTAPVLVDTSAATPFVVETERPLPVPGVALRRSLLVPGWGQVYNRDYIKAGGVVAGIGGLITLVVVFNNRTVRYRRAAIFADCNAGTPLPPGTCDGIEQFMDEWVEAGSLPAAVNRSLRDSNRRNRDFSILLTGIAYALQALDAYVSAHLADFDVSEDLSLHVVPTPTGATAALRWQF